MVFCNLVCMDDTSSSKAGVPRGTPHLLSWRVINRAVLSGGKKIPLHSPSTIQSSNLFGKGLEKQSFWPCTTASHYQSHLPTFVSYIFLSSSSVLLPSCLPLIVFVFLCPCHCRALALFCFFSPLPCSARLTSSSSISFADSFLQFLFTPVLSTLWWKLGAVPSSPTQSSLTDSFISSAANPFNTTCLISVYHHPSQT